MQSVYIFDIMTLKKRALLHSRRNFNAFSFNERNVNRCENGYAVGQYNLNNLEFTQAILEASQEENAPVILGVSEGAARYMSGFIQL